MEVAIEEYSSGFVSMRVEMSTSYGNSYFEIYEDSAHVYCDEYYPIVNIYVIDNSDLYDSIWLNPEGDYVTIYNYFFTDYVSFGNYPDSGLDCIGPGESIIYLNNYNDESGFCISRNPGVGIFNDTTGALGTFSGEVLDTLGNPITEGWFRFPRGGNINISNGVFEERIFARHLTFDIIRIYYSWNTYDDFAVDTVDFCLRPDSSRYQIIQIKALITGIETPADVSEKIVTVSPNPFTGNVTFYFNTGMVSPTDEMKLYVYDTEGRLLLNTSMMPGQTRYDWSPNSSISPGMLVYRLDKNGRTVKSGKLFRL